MLAALKEHYKKHEGKNAYGINLERQNRILDEINTLMTEIKIAKQKFNCISKRNYSQQQFFAGNVVLYSEKAVQF